METFRYHPTGRDNNGNFGPPPVDARWITVQAPNHDAAVALLPPAEQEKVKRSVAEYYEDRSQDTYEGDVVGTFLTDSCGWGAGFSLFNEEDWECFLDECT